MMLRYIVELLLDISNEREGEVTKTIVEGKELAVEDLVKRGQENWPNHSIVKLAATNIKIRVIKPSQA